MKKTRSGLSDVRNFVTWVTGKNKPATIWNGFGKYMGGLENSSRPTLQDQDRQCRDQDRDREKIGLRRSRDQQRGLEDYKTAVLRRL